MLATAIIVFREILEAALVVGIVLAASRGARGRARWVGIGIGAGVAGAGAVAAFAESIAVAADGFGPEILNAGILFTAVAMLGWHNVWMGRHGRDIAQQMSRLGHAVRDGGRPLYVLAVVVGAAVLREGSETVLFLYGIAVTDSGHSAEMLIGGSLGLAGGVACGGALYLGLVKVPTRYLFTVTSWMILLLAAGLASQGAAFLVQAGMLPALGAQLWNSSGLLGQDSIAGRVLHTLIGYDDRPTGIQLVFYASTLAIIGVLMRTLGQGGAGRRPPQPVEDYAQTG